MNIGDIMRLAQQAGGDDWVIFRDFMPEIEHFAGLVAEASRETCAKELEAEGWIAAAQLVRGSSEYDGKRHYSERWRA